MSMPLPEYRKRALEANRTTSPGEELVSGRRCPTCGGLLRVIPCRLCATRSAQRNNSIEPVHPECTEKGIR